MAKAKAKTKTKAKAKPAAKAKAKAKPAAKKAAKVVVAAKPKKKKAAAKPRAKVVAEPKGGLVAKARAATEALVARAKAATEAIVAKVKREAPAAPDRRTSTPGMEPFQLTETSPGTYSLLLTTFDAAAPAFDTIGIDGGGYAWDGVARRITSDEAALGNRIKFDPEASMFCAYSDDRAGLEDLGKRLSALFHDLPRLTDLVKEIGPGGFED